MPAEPAFVDIAFVRGVPTALNGVVLPLTELVASLGMLAATHGVGHIVDERLVCAAPAAVLLHAAHGELTRAATSPEVEPFSAAARLRMWISSRERAGSLRFARGSTRISAPCRRA